MKHKRTQAVNLFLEAYEIYVGGPYDGTDPRELSVGQPGFLGNPFHGKSPEKNLILFKNYFLERIKSDTKFRQAVISSYGQNLGCACNPSDEPYITCHAHFVADWVNGHYDEYRNLLDPELVGSRLKH